MGSMLAMALLAQIAAGAPPAGGGGGFRDMSGEGPNAFPERWRYDLTAAVPRLVSDTASAEIAPPLFVITGGKKRYIACIRVEGPTRIDPSPGLHEYVALFDRVLFGGDGHLLRSDCTRALLIDEKQCHRDDRHHGGR